MVCIFPIDIISGHSLVPIHLTCRDGFISDGFHGVATYNVTNIIH
jgi:hypothetical protein